MPSSISQALLFSLLDLFSIALAFCGAAHLSELRRYSRAFVKLAFHKYGSESGLRCPLPSELQVADREAWASIQELVTAGWSLNTALHEIVSVRCTSPSMHQAWRGKVLAGWAPSLPSLPPFFPFPAPLKERKVSLCKAVEPSQWLQAWTQVYLHAQVLYSPSFRTTLP